jgi:hypothetical protein
VPGCANPSSRQALRFYVLLVGVMNLFYVVWDYIDDRLFDKRNSSDCAQFSELLGWPTSGSSKVIGSYYVNNSLVCVLVHL